MLALMYKSSVFTQLVTYDRITFKSFWPAGYFYFAISEMNLFYLKTGAYVILQQHLITPLDNAFILN